MHSDVARCLASLSSVPENVHKGLFGPAELEALFRLASGKPSGAAPDNE